MTIYWSSICPEGQDVLKALAAKADVVVENYKLGGLKKYGLDYPSLSALNPRLVYCSITGFGQDGPYAPRAGYDFMIQAMGGLMSVTGEKDTLPGGGPQKAGIAIADLSTGLHAVIAILAALNQRHRSGKGQHIDLSLLDVQVSMMSNQAQTFLVSGQAPVRAGNGHAAIVPYQAFPTADGHLIIAVGNDGQFAKLAESLGHGEWAADERFISNSGRVRNRSVLIPLIEAETARFTSEHLLRMLEQSRIPCGPINSMDKVFDDPQVQARHLRRDASHGLLGRVPMVASPLRLSDSPVTYDRGPPLLGEHTEDVLHDLLDMDSARLADLRAKGAI
ncbi:MAG: CoA transferase [Magnetospirillum sp.]|nr:CoA transferase [Magnetospirillum sp.]